MSKIEKLRELLPWKRKGYKILDKFDTAKPWEGDRRVLMRMIERGTDLARERHVVHYLYFPNDEAREIAEHKLHQNGYMSPNGVGHGEIRPKSLIAERNGLINEAIVDKERELLTDIAEADGGEYDGWEAALD